jgi:hypothetical protein
MSLDNLTANNIDCKQNLMITLNGNSFNLKNVIGVSTSTTSTISGLHYVIIITLQNNKILEISCGTDNKLCKNTYDLLSNLASVNEYEYKKHITTA